jgi:hypothetical protein
MTMIIVETEPGVFIRLPQAEAERLGFKAVELKPITPEKNKASKPAKKKTVEINDEPAPAAVEEAASVEADHE